MNLPAKSVGVLYEITNPYGRNADPRPEEQREGGPSASSLSKGGQCHLELLGPGAEVAVIVNGQSSIDGAAAGASGDGRH